VELDWKSPNVVLQAEELAKSILLQHVALPIIMTVHWELLCSPMQVQERTLRV
jgi:hypothetical protein